MKILVTGGFGFIGSNLVRLLLKSGHRILNIDKLTYAGNVRSLADVQDEEALESVEIDICSQTEIRKEIRNFQPDAVIHLAAESHVDRSIDSPGQFIQTNLVGTYVMLHEAYSYWLNLEGELRDHFRFIHVSTDEVYGSLGAEGKFTEETAYDPHSPYSASKAGSDHLARAWYDTYGFPVIVTNCSNNFGPYQFPEKLLPLVILRAIKEEAIPVYGRGENVRDWLYVEDHCSALTRVLSHGSPGETYNIGGDNEWKNIDLVKLLCGILDDIRPRPSGQPYSTLIEFVKDRPGHDLRYAIDATKIRKKLGWRPAGEPSALFRSTVQWYLDNESWCTAILDGSYRLERIGLDAK